MAGRRVVFISSITSGSKFRLVANRRATVKAAKKQGTAWVTCAMNDQGGNLSRPSMLDKPFVPTQGYSMGTGIIAGNFSVMRAYPPSFNAFNLPCPRRWNYRFPNFGKQE